MGQWIVGVMNFQKMYGLKHHVVEIRLAQLAGLPRNLI